MQQLPVLLLVELELNPHRVAGRGQPHGILDGLSHDHSPEDHKIPSQVEADWGITAEFGLSTPILRRDALVGIRGPHIRSD